MSVPAADDGHTSSAARRDERNRARNDERRYMTLATRLAIAMILLVAIAVAAVGWLSYWSVEQAVLPRVLDRLETHSRLIASDLEGYVAGARGDIAGYRAAASLNGLIRARLAGGIDAQDGVSEQTWRERIATRLAAEIDSKPAYAQFRIIGAGDGEPELVRVDRTGPNGTARIASDDELQRKGERQYFQETIGLAPGELYVSTLEPASVRGGTTTAHTPTLRVGSPLFTPDGKPFGIILVNIEDDFLSYELPNRQSCVIRLPRRVYGSRHEQAPYLKQHLT